MSEQQTENSTPMFKDLALRKELIRAIEDLGYERPTPIQAQSIPVLLSGQDIIGQAQTGTGKTAAFALPLLTSVDLRSKSTQVIILAPTRELALQVSNACRSYGKHMKGLNVLAVYGGAAYGGQLRELKKGAHVVVGTPGRVMDHLRRKTLQLGKLKSLVLDEADEMLRMGFIDDVEWILEQTPSERQIALFSATMPTVIKKIADKHLHNPAHIKIINKTATVETTTQRHMILPHRQKMDAMIRVLEGEEHDGVIIFVRTKIATNELAGKLQMMGYKAEALNGDIAQNQRERIVEQLKNGRLNLLVATDVVARGLDVDRISHVINFDAPHDSESYIHRIGRTGRAGRTGNAVLFLTPREKRMLGTIERATKQKIPALSLPSTEEVNAARVDRFKQKVVATTSSKNIDTFKKIFAELQSENDIDEHTLGAALAMLAQGKKPLFLKEHNFNETEKSSRRNRDRNQQNSAHRSDNRRPKRSGNAESKPAPAYKPDALPGMPEVEMQRFHLQVGNRNGVKPGNIVGAIANEADIESKYIGTIEIRDDYSTVDLPSGMPKSVFKLLKRTRVSGRPLGIDFYDKETDNSRPPKKRKPRKNQSGAHKKRPPKKNRKNKNKNRKKKN